MSKDSAYTKLRGDLCSSMHDRCIATWRDMDERMVTKHAPSHHLAEATRLLDTIWPDIERWRQLARKRSDTCVRLENRIRELEGREPLDLS